MVFAFLCLISLSIVTSSSTHVGANGKISFFFMVEQYSTVCMYIYMYMYIHDGHSLLLYLGYCKSRCNKHRGAHLFKLLFSFSLNKYPEVKLFYNMVSLFLILRTQSFKKSFFQPYLIPPPSIERIRIPLPFTGSTQPIKAKISLTAA